MIVTKMVETTEGSLISVSPSFNSYSSEKIEDIAARVIEELHGDSHSLQINDNTCPALYSFWKSDAVCLTSHEESRRDGNYNIEAVGHEEDDEGFEFSFVSGDENSSPISADEIFYNGQIRPVYPIFDQSLLFDYERNDNGNDDNSGSGSLRVPATSNDTGLRRRRPPLKKLMLEERGAGSCSSSASDPDDVELDGVEPGTYCVWNPKSGTAREPSCRKSKSTGTSSKRWKLLDLFLRSQSDGKDSLVFVSHNQTKRTPSMKVSISKLNKEVEKTTFVGAIDDLVTKKDAGVDKAKRRTMLPHRPAKIVGLFHNVNGVVEQVKHLKKESNEQRLALDSSSQAAHSSWMT